jgi:hypothetical protein
MNHWLRAGHSGADTLTVIRRFCPGGNRLWPKPGYWNTGEFSGWVGACTGTRASLTSRDF